ncbi:hypothetical protein KIN20_009383 [Parelaphostrongylus tenuis]|uniref:Uncharacterized protein n=1 Tax=Parelaphostrongylus tenuis TaxID=148309 RepID=A0AAD5QI86_PARTN|nr:hypothetical protein KIN20_009383 [Parelaphostrongylus tenuis]
MTDVGNEHVRSSLRASYEASEEAFPCFEKAAKGFKKAEQEREDNKFGCGAVRERKTDEKSTSLLADDNKFKITVRSLRTPLCTEQSISMNDREK